MFSKSAQYYDKIYHWKDYAAETQRLQEIITQYKRSAGHTLLDVACGTGGFTYHLCEQYSVEGLDLDEGLLAVARERMPETTFYQGDMRQFDLGKQYDVVICLFSSIGYVKTVAAMQPSIANFARHIKPGGVVIIEPWFAPGVIQHGHVSLLSINEPELKIVRMNRTTIEDRISALNFEYLIGTPQGIEHLAERHELGLFTIEEQIAAFQNAGLQVEHDPVGLTDRGLYIGWR